MAEPGYVIYTYDDSTSAWSSWNTDYYCTSTATTTSASTDLVWYGWCSQGTTTSAAISTTDVWYQWNSSGNWEKITVHPVVDNRTPEEIAAAAERARQEAERQRKMAEEHQRLAAEAEARAEALLKQNLDAAQRAEYEKEKCFTVISKDGERRYRVKKGWSHNVERIDKNGKRMHTLCAHPIEQVPEFDNMLAQKCLLEHAEEHFLKVANVGGR